jgi:signal transduction histidine kinase
MTAVHALGQALHSTIDLSALLVALDGFLMQTVKPERVVFIVRTPDGTPATTYFFHGADHSKALEGVATNVHAPLFFQEHEEEESHGCFAAVVPLFAHEHTSSTMLLGKKLSDDIFRSKDIELLSIVAHQAGMAIENAQLYEAERRHGAELERRVRERTEEIRSMQEAQSKFVTDISHELQTPVAVLTANMEIVEGKRTGNRKMALAVASATLGRMAQMVSHLLANARLNFSKEKLHKKEIVVENLLEQAYNDCFVLAEDKKVLLSYSSDPVRIVGDADRLKEVILNLISNALKHTERGGKIVLSGKKVGHCAEISVGDSGSGIAPDKIPHIFERFYRIDANEHPGNGLGLDICRQIVEMHGGNIRAESEPGKGSVFIVSLPLAPLVSKNL